MKWKHTLPSLLLASLLALPSIGCVVHGRGHIRGPSAHISVPAVAVVEYEEEPPPPQVHHVVVRPGFIYVDGRWDRRGGRWVWLDGHYERQRVGHTWNPGRWERRGRRHVWVEGRWHGGGGHDRGPVIRDHRGNDGNRGRGNDGGVIIRDHR